MTDNLSTNINSNSAINLMVEKIKLMLDVLIKGADGMKALDQLALVIGLK